MSSPLVVHVVTSDQRRGAEVFAADLVRALAERGVEQRVVVLRPGGAATVDFPVPTTRLRAPVAAFAGTAVSVLGLRRALAGQAGAVVCAHGGEALRAAVLAGAGPIVYRRIGSAPPSLTRGLRRQWHRWLMGRAALVVCVAHGLREEAVRLFALSPQRVRTVPNGVDPRRLAAPDRAASRQALGLPLDARVVLSLGSLSADKDPLRALRITESAREGDRRVVHLLVGDGPLAAEVQWHVRGGQVVVLPGRDDVGTVLRASDALLLCSPSEGMPAVVIEAGLAGLPVIADRLAGVAEVVVDGESGVLVGPGDDQAAAGAVSGLLSDADRRGRLGAAALLRCTERFAIGPVADAYLAAFAELTDGADTRETGVSAEQRVQGISVLICCKDGAPRLPGTLEALARQEQPGVAWEVILVDNGSTDGSADVAREVWAAAGTAVPLRVVDERRPGHMAARLRGIRTAAHDLVIFVDDDNHLDAAYLRIARKAFDDEPTLGAAGGTSTAVTPGPHPAWFDTCAGMLAVGRQDSADGPLGYLWGAGLCLRASAVGELLGRGWEPGLSGRVGSRLTSSDDVELVYALRLLGWSIRYVPDLRLEHHLPASRLELPYLVRLAGATAMSNGYLTPVQSALSGRPARPWAGVAAMALVRAAAQVVRSRSAQGSPGGQLRRAHLLGRARGLLDPRAYRAGRRLVRLCTR